MWWSSCVGKGDWRNWGWDLQRWGKRLGDAGMGNVIEGLGLAGMWKWGQGAGRYRNVEMRARGCEVQQCGIGGGVA